MSYWETKGIHQTKLDILHNLIESMLGERGVKNPVKNKQLERLRRMKNAYYRLFNDGDPNAKLLGISKGDIPHMHTSASFRKIRWDRITKTADKAMDEQILAAWDEQIKFGNIKGA